MDKALERVIGLIGVLAKTRINGEARQLLDAIILSTGTGEAVTLSNSEIANTTELGNDGICRARNGLQKLNIVELERMNIDRQGVWNYRLREASEWRILPTRGTRQRKPKKTIIEVIKKAFRRKTYVQ